MKHWNEELDIVLQRGYTPEAIEGITALETLLDENTALGVAHDEIVYRYAVSEEMTMTEALAAFEKMETEFGVSKYSLEMLLMLNSLPALHEKYRQNGISDTVYYDTVDGKRMYGKQGCCRYVRGVVVRPLF